MKMYKEVVDLLAEGQAGVLVTIVATEGATPRKSGTKMLIRANGDVNGSIGGGKIEIEVQQAAIQVLSSNEPKLVSFAENEKDALSCGGRITVFLEPFSPGPILFIIGNGHVGQALARIAVDCGWPVHIFDDRPALNEPVGLFLQVAGYDDLFSHHLMSKETYVVIASRSHAFDLQALRATLQTEAGFIGLLGSKKKKASFFAALREEGVSDGQLARVVTPVGLTIGARSPEEIAVSIMAQLINVQRECKTSSKSV